MLPSLNLEELLTVFTTVAAVAGHRKERVQKILDIF